LMLASARLDRLRAPSCRGLAAAIVNPRSRTNADHDCPDKHRAAGSVRGRMGTSRLPGFALLVSRPP
jgi:hypothetical protein